MMNLLTQNKKEKLMIELEMQEEEKTVKQNLK